MALRRGSDGSTGGGDLKRLALGGASGGDRTGAHHQQQLEWLYLTIWAWFGDPKAILVAAPLSGAVGLGLYGVAST